MPMFSQSSFSKLSTCHIELQTLFYEVIKHFDCSVTEGYRSQEDQDKDFEKGVTTLKWPNGKHNSNPSMAVDVYPYPIDLKNKSRFYWFAGFVMGIAQRLKDEGKMSYSVRYGGDWNRDYDINEPGLKDLVHFELV